MVLSTYESGRSKDGAPICIPNSSGSESWPVENKPSSNCSVLLWIAAPRIVVLFLTESARARRNSGNASKICYLQTNGRKFSRETTAKLPCKPVRDYESHSRDNKGGRANRGVFDPARVGRFEPGQIIADRFVVVRFIARGGMGEVYEVEDGFLQGVHRRTQGESSHRSRETRDHLTALSRKSYSHGKQPNPNLCPIYDISRCEEPPPPFLFLTMKLLSGETLASRLQRPALLSRSENRSDLSPDDRRPRCLTCGRGGSPRYQAQTNVMLDHSGTDI